MTDFEKLSKNLNDQRAACAKMLGMEEEKTRALISGDTRALLSVLGAQQALMMAQKALEEKRMALCAGQKQATLGALIEAHPECRATLEPVFTELKKTVTALKKMNAKNQKLLETRLTTIRFMNERLGIGTPNTYAKAVRVKA